MPIKKTGVIWNKTDTPPADLAGVQTLGCIPNDELVLCASVQAKTVFDLGDDAPALVAVREIVGRQLCETKVK